MERSVPPHGTKCSNRWNKTRDVLSVTTNTEQRPHSTTEEDTDAVGPEVEPFAAASGGGNNAEVTGNTNVNIGKRAE